MKVTKLLGLLGLLIWFVIAFFFSLFFAYGAIQFPSTQNFSSVIFSMIIRHMPFAAISVLPIYFAFSYFNLGRIYFRRVGLSLLLFVILSVFFAGRSGIFTLMLFPNYPGTQGTYSVVLETGFVNNIFPSFTFKTTEETEKIIEFYQPILKKKGVRIHAHGGYKLIGGKSQYQYVYRGDNDLSRYLNETRSSGSDAITIIRLAVSCNSNNKTVSNLEIRESPNGEIFVRFIVSQGASLLAPLTLCLT